MGRQHIVRLVGHGAWTLVVWLMVGIRPGIAAADLSQISRFDIQPQELPSALLKFSEQSGIQVTSPGALIEGKTSPGVVGQLEGRRALDSLLRNTALGYDVVDSRSIVITPPDRTASLAVSLRSPGESEKGAVAAGSPSLWTRLRLAQGAPAAQANEAQTDTGSVAAPPPASSNKPLPMGEIVVTARKREETTFEIPATISIFNREAIQESGADSISDIQFSIPNFFFSSQRPFATNVTMRGMGAALAAPGVGMYIDGAYQLGTTAFTLPLYDVERVEILKGPQGTLYGRNSFAGVINYITRKPSNELSADLSAEAGNGGTYKGAASVSGPLIADVLSARISVGMQRREGFRDYPDGSDADVDDYDAVNGVVAFKPSEQFEARLRYSYIDKSGGSFLYYTAADINAEHGALLVTSPFTVGPNAGQRQGDHGLNLSSYNLNMTYSWENVDLVSLSTYDNAEDFVYYDSDIALVDGINARTEHDRDTWAQELRLQSTGHGAFTWLAAVYYSEGTEGGANILGGLNFPGGVFQKYNETEFTSRAVFTDLEYALGEHWIIGAGARYDSVNKIALPLTPTGVTLDKTFTNTQPKFTVKYLFDSDRQVYATAAKGFREGGFVPTLLGTPFEAYPNDVLWSYETGLKSRFADRRGNLDVALFYIDAESLNGTALVPTPLGSRLITVPIGKAESYGIELTTSYEVTDNFTVNVLGGYNKATPTELVTGVQPGTAVVDEQVINAPLWNVRVGGTLNVPLPNDRSVKLQASVNGVGPTNFLGENIAGAPLTERDPYYLLDLRAAYKWNNYTLTAFVENATDSVYAADYRPVSTSRPFGGGPLPGVLYNLKRYYGLSFRAEL